MVSFVKLVKMVKDKVAEIKIVKVVKLVKLVKTFKILGFLSNDLGFLFDDRAFFSVETRVGRTAPRRERHGGAQVLRLPRGLDLDGAGLEERPGEVECGRSILPARILNTTSIWIRQGIGLAHWRRGGGGGAFWALVKSKGLLHANEDGGSLDSAGNTFGKSRF